MNGDRYTEKPKKKLVIFFVGIMLAIIVAIITIVLVRTSNDKHDNEMPSAAKSLLDSAVKEAMPGVEGGFPPSTEALAFSNMITRRMKSGTGYSLNDAAMEWKTVFEGASGELKFFLGIQYAKFVYEYENDFNRAVEILESLSDYSDNHKDYYNNAFYELYVSAGLEAEAEQYKLKGNNSAEGGGE